MAHELGLWQGFRVILDPDRGTSSLVVHHNTVLTSTIGNIHGSGYFNVHRKPVSNWVVTEVLARGTRLHDRDFFNPEGAYGTKMRAVDFANNNNNGLDLSFLVGYSPYTLELVFASAPRSNTNGVRLNDELTGLQFRANPGEVIVGGNIILHHSLAVPGNMEALKRAFIEKDWSAALEHGDLVVDEVANAALRSCDSIFRGDTPRVIERINMRPASAIPDHGRPDLDALEDAARPAPDNRPWRQLLPKLEQHIMNNSRVKGFCYKVPCMSNMVYPDELYQKLAEFARGHAHDMLNAKAMLFAAQLWVDIMEHPNRMLESFVQDRGENLYVSLSIFLVYFEAWLKAHEYLKCIAFAHPFRIIKRMYHQDIQEDALQFAVNRSLLDETEIRRLILTANVQRQEFDSTTRIELFPFTMPGTAMASPQDLHRFTMITPTQRALIGMPDIRILGLPSLHNQEGNRRIIAMPEAIARLSFHGIETPMQVPAPDGLMDVSTRGPTSILGDRTTAGAIWDHEFQPIMNHVVREHVWKHSPSLNPALLMEDFVYESQRTVWSQKVNRRLDWLRHLNVLGKVQLVCGPDGLPYYDGMPFEDEAHLIPPSAIPSVISRALQDPGNANLFPQPLVPAATLQQIISDLETRPKYTHVAWQRALNKLNSMVDRPTPTLEIVEILDRYIASCESDFDGMVGFIEQAQSSLEVFFITEPYVRSWLHQYQCRLVSIEADTVADGTWWDDTGSRLAEAWRNRVALMYIQQSSLQIKEALDHRFSGNPNHPASLEHAGFALEIIKIFMRVQENGDLMAKMRDHISHLRNKVQQGGFGSLL
ncbi:hypothetical protein F66182_5795 [Fusarium sp. NRRL 66182]|nr:hypothetical protein F66182_5795 [Fusarium sp. NRRL 66182]